MKQEKNHMNPASPNISVEDFDTLDGTHEFSEKYKKNKKQMLRAYRKSVLTSTKKKFTKVAVAATFLLVSAPIVANAATNGTLFNKIWGNEGKENVASHDAVVFDDDKDTSYTVTYPQREYEDVNSEKAKSLIGDIVLNDPIITDFGDTKLTILSSVVDGNAAVVEFVLEREGGVNALNYSQLDNESKGAYFSDDATFWFHFTDCNENIYVDLDQSSEDKLYCYDYMTLNSFDEGNGLTLETYEYPCTRGELQNSDDEAYSKYMDETKISSISVPVESEVKPIEYVNSDGGSILISPLSMKIDMNTGLGLSKDEAYDPYSAYYVSINYKDGTNYIVGEHAVEGVHSCDIEIDNSSYTCSNLQYFTCVFNHLVDTDNIDSITVNETKYTMKLYK